jgi:hypothetical protein
LKKKKDEGGLSGNEDAGESNSEEENESPDQEESEDDDVRWYKEEVGEAPDKGRNGYF